MKQISEIITDHIDDENLQHIDAYFDEDADSEGKTIAVVDRDTKKVIFFDNMYRGDKQVKEAIKEIHDSIVIESPKIVVVITKEGVIGEVVTTVHVDVTILDLETDGSDDIKTIPNGIGGTDKVHICGDVNDVNPERVKEINNALNA